MKIQVRDRSSNALQSARLYDDNDFLRVPARAARIGIQQYTAAELGLKDRNPAEIINVYRPPEEVFAADSLASYKDVDVTVQHPNDMVTSETFDSVSVGHVTSEGRREGDWVICDLIVKSKDAINSIESGLCEVSMGYEMELQPKQGVTDSGDEYEFVQSALRMNHIALVTSARAGGQARIFDEGKVSNMPKVKLLDGKTVTLEDDNTATLIQQSFDSLMDKLDTAENKIVALTKDSEKFETALQMADEEKEELKDKFEKEKEKSNDSAVEARAAALVDARAKAKLIAGDSFSCNATSVIDVQRAALTDSYSTIDWSDKSADVIGFAFDMYAKKKDEEMEEEKEKQKKASDSHKKLGDEDEDEKEKMKDANPQMARDSAYEQFMNGTINKEG